MILSSLFTYIYLYCLDSITLNNSQEKYASLWCELKHRKCSGHVQRTIWLVSHNIERPSTGVLEVVGASFMKFELVDVEILEEISHKDTRISG